MDSLRSAPFGKVFRPDNFVFGKCGISLRYVNKLVNYRLVRGINHLQRNSTLIILPISAVSHFGKEIVFKKLLFNSCHKGSFLNIVL